MATRVLLAEDVGKDRSYLSGILKEEKFQVATAANLSDGLQSLRQEVPDLAVIDLSLGATLGDFDGMVLVEEVAKMGIPFIVISVYLSPAYQRNLVNFFHDRGLIDIIHKDLEAEWQKSEDFAKKFLDAVKRAEASAGEIKRAEGKSPQQIEYINQLKTT